MDSPLLRNCRSSARRCAGQGGGPRRREGWTPARAVIFRTNEWLKAELGADSAQREAGGDTLDDGTITRLNLRGACG